MQTRPDVLNRLILRRPSDALAEWGYTSEGLIAAADLELLHVIAGALTVEVEGQGNALIEAREAVIIPADLAHLARNESATATGKALYRLHNGLNRYFSTLSGGNCLLFSPPEL